MKVKITQTIPPVLDELKPQAAAVVAKGAFDVAAKMKTEMAEPKHGKVRKVGNVIKRASKKLLDLGLKRSGKTGVVAGAKIHIASAPGEAPAIDEGTLSNSIDIQFSNDGLTAEISVGAEYGIPLELGTVKMEARPFASPALEFVIPSLEDALGQLGA